MMRDIKTAIDAGDADALTHAAHALKGSIGNFCAQACYSAGAKLEQIGRSGNLGGVTEAWNHLDELMAQGRAKVDARRKEESA